MENASKALIMAGSVLIALMIIGALVLMFSNLSSYQETDVRDERSAQVVEFNNRFVTYNRKDVRGSELYSLLNSAINYNRTQSTAGIRDSSDTTWADQGQDVEFKPIEIEFNINISQLSADNVNRLFEGSGNKIYIVNQNKNTFENEIKDMISKLESAYGTSSLTNLTTNITKIFPVNPSESQKNNAVLSFKSACKKNSFTTVKNDGSNGTTYTLNNITWNDLKENRNGSIRENVYSYYEYVQFKRARFDCTEVRYDENTGRITKMKFKFTGEFN